jgi:hypothetical protein
MNKILVPLVATAILLFAAISAKAQILLDINDSDSSNIIITSTGAAAGTAASTFAYNGIDLIGFFTTNVAYSQFTVNSTSIIPSGANVNFDTAYGDTALGQADLSFYYGGSSTVAENFTTSAPAFSGVASLGVSGGLQSNGTIGNIALGYSGSSPNTIIGQYEIVNTVAAPEPSTWMFLVGGLALVTVSRIRRISIRA